MRVAERAFLVAVLAVLCTALACAEGGPIEPAARGQRIYAINCTTCHNTDPGRPGTIGPALAGKPSELIRSMVLNGEPPGGYVSRAPGVRMPPLPHLADHVDDLAAYLTSVMTTAGERPGTSPGRPG